MLRSDKMVVHPEWEALLKGNGLDTVRGVYENSAGHAIASSGTTEVREVELRSKDSAQPRLVFIKRYWFPSFGSRWNGALRGTLFGRSKVRREFDNLAWLRAHGFDAPLPVAWGEERSGGWLTRSLLISEGIPQPVALSKFIRDTLPSRPAATRRDLIERLAALTRRLHEQRFVHHDLFWRNIILCGESLERFSLIDAHKGRVWRAGAELRSRVEDLAALDAPAPWYFRRTERLRFFLRYRGQARLTPEDKALLRATLQLAEPMRERQWARVTGVKRARS